MTTTSHQRKMFAAVATFAVSLAAPALMFIGSGAAHADTNVCTPYDEGYSDGVFGGPGKCFADDSKQSQFNSGYLDGRAGRPSNPVNPFPVTINPNLGLPQQSTMSPWDGRPGSSPEPPEFPEYHEPGEPYEPAEQPWEQMEPPVIP